jgi:hypothetical protein
MIKRFIRLAPARQFSTSLARFPQPTKPTPPIVNPSFIKKEDFDKNLQQNVDQKFPLFGDSVNFATTEGYNKAQEKGILWDDYAQQSTLPTIDEL